MGEIKAAADEAFRDYVTDGVPATGAFDPDKAAIRTVFDTIDAKVEEISAIRADDARRWPPGADRSAYAAWPNVVNTVAFMRYGASGEYRLIRELRASGMIVEFVLIPVAAVNANVSYDVISIRTYWNGGLQIWFEDPFDGAARTNTLWAVRHGLNTDSYNTVFNNISGLYHNRYNVTAAPTIQLNGTGTNLESIGNMPTGTILYGTSVVIGPTTYKLLSPATAENIQVQTTQIFDPTNCLIEDNYINALVSNVVIAEAPILMHAVLPPLKGGYATHGTFKTTGLEIELLSDGQQKGNWRKSPLPAAGADTLMWWNQADRTLLFQKRAGVGPFIQNNGGTLTRFQYDNFAVAHITDDLQTAKATGFGWSAAETSPAFQSFPTGDTHRFVNIVSVDIVPGGPS